MNRQQLEQNIENLVRSKVRLSFLLLLLLHVTSLTPLSLARRASSPSSRTHECASCATPSSSD